MPEILLHYIWQQRLWAMYAQQTIDGQPIEVLSIGQHNRDAGPDFSHAHLRIGQQEWVGNVEIHVRASDWRRHHHHTDPAYNNVILHIASHIDAEVQRSNGESIPQLQLDCPEHVLANFNELIATDSYPPCYRIIPSLSSFTVHSWMSALQMERFEQKNAQLIERLRLCNNHWEDAFFMTLARNFGFGLNGDAFETWAKHIPLRAVDKHRDNLFQIEAIFFGQAGILDDPDGDEYYLKLKREYEYLAHKFGLTPMDVTRWRFLRLRPNNFPHIRIAQLACLYHRAYGLLSQLMEKTTLKEIRDLLRGGTSEYWLTHYAFGGSSPSRPKTLSESSLDLLIINAVVTFLYAYGIYQGKEELCSRANRFLEELKPENNYIIRMWSQCGLKVSHAGDSQALIQLKKEYCDKKKCLYCRIGYEYLKRK